jgi:hypothetical protein
MIQRHLRLLPVPPHTPTFGIITWLLTKDELGPQIQLSFAADPTTAGAAAQRERHTLMVLYKFTKAQARRYIVLRGNVIISLFIVSSANEAQGMTAAQVATAAGCLRWVGAARPDAPLRVAARRAT